MIPTTTTSAATVLIADDEPGCRDLLYDILRDHFSEVIVVPDGLSALRVSRARQPSAILLDIGMPGRDGLEVLRTLRGSPEFADTPILIFTGRGGSEDLLEAFDAGASDFVRKPLDPFEVAARVVRLVREADRRRESRAACEESLRRGEEAEGEWSESLEGLQRGAAVVQGIVETMGQSAGVEGRSAARLVEELRLRIDDARMRLELRRIERGGAPRRPRDLFLLPLARRAAERLEPLATDRGVRIHAEPRPLPPPTWALFDPESAERLLAGETAEAVRCAREGSTVRIECRDDGSIRISAEADRGESDAARARAEVREALAKALGAEVVRTNAPGRREVVVRFPNQGGGHGHGSPGAV